MERVQSVKLLPPKDGYGQNVCEKPRCGGKMGGSDRQISGRLLGQIPGH